MTFLGDSNLPTATTTRLDNAPRSSRVRLGIVTCAALLCMLALANSSLRDILLGGADGSEEKIVVRSVNAIANGKTLLDETLNAPEFDLPSSSASARSEGRASPPLDLDTAARTAELTGNRTQFRLSRGYNPPGCRGEPNTTTIHDTYQGCPVPGMNNLLYTQHNRWYCVYRDNLRYLLRDKTCNKGTGEKYRYTSILQVRYDRLRAFNDWRAARLAVGVDTPIPFGNSRSAGGHPGLDWRAATPAERAPAKLRDAFDRFRDSMADTRPFDPSTIAEGRENPSMCWLDIGQPPDPPRCTWSDIPSFYGKPHWWEARHFIDFHPEYYAAARSLLARVGAAPDAGPTGDQPAQGRPFISMHLRRGDYIHHCVVIKRKRIPAFAAFWGVGSLVSADGSAFESCWPSKQQVVDVIEQLTAKTGIDLVFIATNVAEEFQEFLTHIDQLRSGLGSTGPRWQAFALPPLDSFQPTPLEAMRGLDVLVLDMVIMSLGSHFVFNRYSSLSGTAYELAAIHGRANSTNVNVW
jgi:hypothetical protein